MCPTCNEIRSLCHKVNINNYFTFKEVIGVLMGVLTQADYLVVDHKLFVNWHQSVVRSHFRTILNKFNALAKCASANLMKLAETINNSRSHLKAKPLLESCINQMVGNKTGSEPSPYIAPWCYRRHYLITLKPQKMEGHREYMALSEILAFHKNRITKEHEFCLNPSSLCI